MSKVDGVGRIMGAEVNFTFVGALNAVASPLALMHQGSQALLGSLMICAAVFSVGRHLTDLYSGYIQFLVHAIAVSALLSAYPGLMRIYAQAGDSLVQGFLYSADAFLISEAAFEVAQVAGDDDWFDINWERKLLMVCWSLQMLAMYSIKTIAAIVFAVLVCLGPLFIAVSILPVYSFIGSVFKFALVIICWPLVPGIGALIVSRGASNLISSSPMFLSAITLVLGGMAFFSPKIIEAFIAGAGGSALRHIAAPTAVSGMAAGASSVYRTERDDNGVSRAAGILPGGLRLANQAASGAYGRFERAGD